MSAEADTLRSASRRLALRFAALIVALFLLMAGIVIGLVAVTEHAALTQQLVNAEHLDSPHDAPPGTYIAIVEQGGVVTSDNPPPGFPIQSAIDQVTASGRTLQQTAELGGQSFIVRTDGDSGRVVQVAINRSQSGQDLGRVILALALAGLPAVAGAALIGWWMSLRAMRPLADALALQRRFVADAGHELRTPLTLLSTRAQLLRRALPGDAAAAGPFSEVPAGLDEIVADAKQLTGILEDLLIAADPRQDAERSDVDLSGVAQDAVRSVQAQASAQGLSVECAAPTPVLVSGVRVALYRAVLALLSNALDHARSGVAVAVTTVAGDAVVEVRDDGPGFPPGAAERAFERFASTRTMDADGTGQRHYGLGLALVAEVAQRHGGAVAIATGESGGAVVQLRMPLKSSP